MTPFRLSGTPRSPIVAAAATCPSDSNIRLTHVTQQLGDVQRIPAGTFGQHAYQILRSGQSGAVATNEPMSSCRSPRSAIGVADGSRRIPIHISLSQLSCGGSESHKVTMMQRADSLIERTMCRSSNTEPESAQCMSSSIRRIGLLFDDRLQQACEGLEHAVSSFRSGGRRRLRFLREGVVRSQRRVAVNARFLRWRRAIRACPHQARTRQPNQESLQKARTVLMRLCRTGRAARSRSGIQIEQTRRQRWFCRCLGRQSQVPTAADGSERPSIRRRAPAIRPPAQRWTCRPNLTNRSRQWWGLELSFGSCCRPMNNRPADSKQQAQQKPLVDSHGGESFR